MLPWLPIYFRYERDFILSVSDDKQADTIDALNTTFSYLDDILNINNVFMTIWLVKYTLQSSNLLKLIPLIPRTCFIVFFFFFTLVPGWTWVFLAPGAF